MKTAVLSIFAALASIIAAPFRGSVFAPPVLNRANRRAFGVKTRDVAFPYRMGAGSAGDVNRTHPASIEPTLQHATTPATEYGQPVIIGTGNAVRPLVAGDSAVTEVYGFTVRPFPIQAASASNYGEATLGAAAPPNKGAIDVMREGYMIVKLRGAAASTKGGRVYVWIAASSGSHVQGGVEAAPTSGSTIVLPQTTLFNGPADANGFTEISRTA